MGKIFLFVGRNYYPEGGLRDFVGLYDNPIDAYREALRRLQDFEWNDDWAQVWDSSQPVGTFRSFSRTHIEELLAIIEQVEFSTHEEDHV